jgi:hypothetical protein
MSAKLELDIINGKNESPLSLYQPSNEVQDLHMEAQRDLEHGDAILTRPFREFNNLSLTQRMSLDQKDWLSWSPEPSSDPDQAWMFTGTSNVTRNNIISLAAHMAEKIIFPSVTAQNNEQQEDKDAAYVARGLLEYNFRQSDYQQTFLFAVISGMVNPVTYYKADYCKAYMSILEGTNSNYTRKMVLDDALSGFQHYLLPADEVLISNPYSFDLHRQKVLIHRRRVSYHEAKQLHGNHPNFAYVTPGLMVTINATDSLFYNVRDPIADNLVEICTYKYRSIDLEFDEVNRIYMGNMNTSFNPFKHRTNKNKPAYNIAKFGSEPIDAKRFWAYKSIASKLSNDKELVDRMRQNFVDASTISTYRPAVTSGAGKMDAGVLKPATVTDISKDAKITFLDAANAAPAFNAMKAAESDIDDAANPSYFGGPSGKGRKTALEVQMQQKNALTNLKVLGIMIGSMTKDIGEIVLHDSLRFQTIGEIGEIVNGLPELKYKSYNIPKVKGGKHVTDKIVFTDAYAGRAMTDEEKDMAAVALVEKHGEDAHVWEVNPDIFIGLDFLINYEPDELMPQNSAFVADRKMEIYDKAINNPLYINNPDKLADITRDFLFEPAVHGEASKYIPDSTKKVVDGIVPGGAPEDPNNPGNPVMPAQGGNKKPALSPTQGGRPMPMGVK